MSLAKEMLKSLQFEENYLEATNQIGEEHIVINEQRQIIVPPSLSAIAVRNDRDVETVTFDCVRYWDEHDLSECVVFINFRLPNGAEGAYMPSSRWVDEEDDSVFHFSWLLQKSITALAGSVQFSIKLVEPSSPAEYIWNSLIGSFNVGDTITGSSGTLPDADIDPILEQIAGVVNEIQADIGNWKAQVVVQETGDSEEAVMSQKATTEALESGEFGGKSAYQYAQEGGYAGTEAEFAEDINPNNIKAKATPTKGIDYFTEADKQEIAEMIDGATIVQAPKYVNSVDEMTDQSRVYVMASTGKIWAYMDTTVEKEITVTDTIEATSDNPYHENSRFGGDGSIATDASGYAGYIVTPIIDLTKEEYVGKTIELHLDGVRYASETAETYIMNSLLDKNKNVVLSRGFTTLAEVGDGISTSVDHVTLAINGEKTSTVTIKIPPYYKGTEIGYMRFCGKGAVADSRIYITYQRTETVTGSAWIDTGVGFGGSGVDNETLAKISALNNEGDSPSTIKLLPKPVLDFYNATAYPDNDYSTSHLEKITYPCRADIPVPFTVKWEYNENAMRTTVAVDTKTIGTVNAHTMLTYDGTGLNKYPIYNLLPNTRYYYKVTHIMADGSLVEAKSGSFTTSTETIRLMYIDGTQNVRDLGGWSGLNGKKVKYGKIFRGAAFSDTSYPELVLTGKGKRALGELKVQAELNLGAADTETSISATCSYHKIGYSNYATAITDATARANFNVALEKIVSWLSEATPRNIYMHCQGGCDRTGTLAFQLLGLLGVSESDLAKEYELSSFSSIGIGRLRTTTKAVDVYDYVGMVEALKTYSGTTITDKFYNFAIACGVSADTITSFRNLMLE